MKSVNSLILVFILFITGFKVQAAPKPGAQEALGRACLTDTFNDQDQKNIENALALGADLNAGIRSSSGPVTFSDTCMAMGIVWGNSGLLQFIISKGALVLLGTSGVQQPGIPIAFSKTAFEMIGEFMLNHQDEKKAVAMLNLLVPQFIKEVNQEQRSIDMPVTGYQSTALAVAAQYGADDSVSLLAKAGANPNAEDSSKVPVLNEAIIYDHPATVALLIQFHANVQCSPSGRCPLSDAAFVGDLQILQTLIANHADARAVGNSGDNALYRATTSHKPSLAALKALVEANDGGADVNAIYINRNGSGVVLGEISPLVGVIIGEKSAEQTEMIKYLLDNHANASAGCSNRQTPYALTRSYGLGDDVRSLLVAAGADPSKIACSYSH